MSSLTSNEAEVIRDIAPDDQMFYDKNESWYFCVGRSTLECIDWSLRAAQKPVTEVKQILDLPCGHGRELRYLKVAFPEAEITACDLLRDGVDFCASTFGAIPVYSNEDPTKIPLERNKFDLIWVGSLLTHLNSDLWTDFLCFFRSCLRSGGVLIFTTHGRTIHHNLIEDTSHFGLPYWRKTAVLYRYERSGFGYANYFGSTSYGISLSHPVWVFEQLSRLTEMRLVHFSERSWAKAHDVYACVRDPGWPVQHLPVSTFTFIKHKVREVMRPRS